MVEYIIFVIVAFCLGEVFGLEKAWKDADKIIDRYKKVTDDAIELVKKYVKGGRVDEEE